MCGPYLISSFLFMWLSKEKKILHYQIGHKFPSCNSKIKKTAEKPLPFLEQLNGRTVEENLVSEERDLTYMTAEFSVAVVRREFMAENKCSVFRSRDIKHSQLSREHSKGHV